jgi:hypothetical protein
MPNCPKQAAYLRHKHDATSAKYSTVATKTFIYPRYSICGFPVLATARLPSLTAHMAPSDSQPRLLPIPDKGFEVLHYQVLPYADGTPTVVQNLGVYPNFAQAQAVARHELERTLIDYHQQGYHGRYSDEIDLNLRGLITKYNGALVDGYLLLREIPLSEFVIKIVEVWDNTWEAEARLAEEELLLGTKLRKVSNMSGTIGARRPEPIVVVRLPVSVDRNPPSTDQRTAVFPYVLKRAEPMHVSESTERPPTPRPHFTEEAEVEWAASRPSWIDVRRKDDTPFRDWEPPYTQRMPFSPPAPPPDRSLDPSASQGVIRAER